MEPARWRGDARDGPGARTRGRWASGFRSPGGDDDTHVVEPASWPPQLAKSADYVAELVVRGGVEPKAYRFFRCIWEGGGTALGIA
jgi:hypothetical protein